MSKPKAKKIICKWCGHSKIITKDLEKAYQQGREDAIDDVFKLISTLLNKDCPNGCYCVDNTELCPYIECIHDIEIELKKLKELKNDKRL